MYRLIMFVCLCTAFTQQACRSKAEASEKPARYAITTPLTTDTAIVKEYVSQIRSLRNIEIRAQEKGFLENIYVDEGQFVKAGQLLFRIMPKLYEAELLKARAEAKAAEIELQNSRTLAEKDVVSKNELAMAQARLDKANAELSLARLHLSFTEIRAPFAGTIDRIPRKLGSLIDEGELLTSLSDNQEMYAYFNVSEPEYLDYADRANLANHIPVKLLLANGKHLKYPGKVETIESEFDSETGNIAFRARFPNPDHLLRNGETGKVLMTVPLKNALIIPQKATYEMQDKTFVFIVDGKGNVKSRNIKIMAQLPDLYIVGEGLSADDKILIEGVQKVKDDMHVETEFVSPQQVVTGLRLRTE